MSDPESPPEPFIVDGDGGDRAAGAETLTYVVTSHYKRSADNPGATQLGSKKLSARGLLNWLATDLPPDAIKMTNEEDHTRLTVLIDLDKFPAGPAGGNQ